MKTLLLFFVGMVSLVAFGQDGSPDLSFGNQGIVITDVDNSLDLVSSLIQQTDEKLIVAGTAFLNNSISKPYLIRYMPNGTLDSTFGNDGILLANYAEGYCETVNLFLDNQQNIVTGGIFSVSQNESFKIAKYDANGEFVNSFGTNGVLTIPNGSFKKMILLADNSLLFLKFTSTTEISFFHYLEDGILNTSFGVNGVATSNFSGGVFTITGLKVDSENNLFVLGIREGSYDSDILLMKFLPSGYLDTNFGNNGVSLTNFVSVEPMNYDLASFDFTTDQKIVIAGSYGDCIDLFQPLFKQYFIRYLSNGQPDLSFGNNGTRMFSDYGFNISEFMIQPDQRMLAIGRTIDCFEASSYTIKRFSSEGVKDNSFFVSLEYDDSKTIMQEDGKIVGTGITPPPNGEIDIIVARFNNTLLNQPEFENQKITIYPNPSNGIFTVDLNFYSEKETYQITDITGKIIAMGELNDKQNQINLSSAQSGVYFLKTVNGVFRLLKN